jgi:predicted RNase H-like HicB family nuclease
MSYRFTVIFEPDEGGFHAFVPALPGCHSFGATLEEAHMNIVEAVELHVESMAEDGEQVTTEPEPFFISRLSIPSAA